MKSKEPSKLLEAFKKKPVAVVTIDIKKKSPKYQKMKKNFKAAKEKKAKMYTYAGS